jgi:hypothetical protein
MASRCSRSSPPVHSSWVVSSTSQPMQAALVDRACVGRARSHSPILNTKLGLSTRLRDELAQPEQCLQYGAIALQLEHRPTIWRRRIDRELGPAQALEEAASHAAL